MAKLNPVDPQYGIPIASRIPQEVAAILSKEAETKGVSLSRYVSKLLADIDSDKRRIKEQQEEIVKQENALREKEEKIRQLGDQIERNRSITQRSVARFIAEVGSGEKARKQLIEIYNKILQDEKNR